MNKMDLLTLIITIGILGYDLMNKSMVQRYFTIAT